MNALAILLQLLQAATALIPAGLAAKQQLDDAANLVLNAQNQGRDLTDDELNQLDAVRHALTAQVEAG
jgi:hypothetical protein